MFWGATSLGQISRDGMTKNKNDGYKLSKITPRSKYYSIINSIYSRRKPNRTDTKLT
jgi:hypothetical protein